MSISKYKQRLNDILLEAANRAEAPARSFKEVAYQRGLAVACGCETTLNSHNHTFFSVQDGIASPEAMVGETARKGFGGIGISDHGTMGAVLRAGAAAGKWKTGRLGDGTMINYTEVDLSEHLESFALCGDDFTPLTLSDDEKAVLPKKALITHEVKEPTKFRILTEGSFTHVGDFKALSGCELYVSWERFKDKKYHHITVYATGMKGHEALVQLTSIGSLPSRRYVSGGGFFRPRVFMEDIEIAVMASEGELIVTTGCPVSITSMALKEGDEAAAREFFDWGVRVLAKENFFAELHICDVSQDFNRFYKKAEDKYWAAVLSVPLSRFTFTSQKEAQAYSEDAYLRFQEVFRRALMGGASTQTASLSAEARANAFEVKGRASILKAQSLSRAKNESSRILTAAMDYFRNVEEADEKATKLKADTVAAARASGESERLALHRIKTDLKKIEKKATRPKWLPDEDSLMLLALAKEVYDLDTKSPRAAVCEFVMMLAAELSFNRQGVDSSSLLELSQAFLAAGTQGNLSSAERSSAMLTLSSSRTLCLDEEDAPETSAIFTLAREGLSDLFSRDGFPAELAAYAPSAGNEDGREKEWLLHPEGNWMEKVNHGLTRLAREYDVRLLAASDAHMATPEQLDTQDAVIKRGQRRTWHMARPYAVPRSDLISFLTDVGRDYSARNGFQEQGNCGVRMLDSGAITMEDLIEAFGSGSLILDNAKCAGSFKWDTVVPKIRYRDHIHFAAAKELMDSGELNRFLLPYRTEPFTVKSGGIDTALIVVYFQEACKAGLIKDNPVYRERFYRELFMMQEVGDMKQADFFLVLSHAIQKFRDRGVSVGPGRGSAAGMLVAYICGITFVDPVEAGLMAERWQTKGRKLGGSQPDIDVDVSDREIAGEVMAEIARAALEEDLILNPPTPLEAILFEEAFFSSVPVTHEEVGGMMIERAVKKEDLKTAFLRNKKLATRHLQRGEDGGLEKESEEDETGGDEAGLFDEDLSNIGTVFQTPTVRVGTYLKLKPKAAVKEAVRIEDRTPFDQLPAFAEASLAWKSENVKRLLGLSDERVNSIYEEEVFGYLPMVERTTRRRVKLGDMITKAMAAGAGMTRLYRNEMDFFLGSVYGEVPAYWEAGKRPPTGSDEARAYFEANPKVKALVLSMFNIYKSPGVHAGGLCLGREVFRRLPLRMDAKGFVSQYEMGDVEKCGILKFDILGLATLNQVSQALRMIVNELGEDELPSWLPAEIYQRVKAGESTDSLWRHMPLSTEEAVYAALKEQAMTFQIDTNNVRPDLQRLDFEKIKALVARSGDLRSKENIRLVELLDIVLALWRPGPMGARAHLDYIDRLMGVPYTTIDPWLDQFTSDTFGLIVYQEQVMKIWYAGARGLDGTKATEEETDDVRRAMGKKKLSALEKIDARGRFIRGAVEQGVPEAAAERIWLMLIPFADYGFNKAHSRCYAYITAVTLFLKAHYQQYFTRVIMGLAKAEDAARLLAEIESLTRPACALSSDDFYWRFIEGNYYPGLKDIKGLSGKHRERLLSAVRGLTVTEARALSPKDYFVRLLSAGDLTESFAKLISEAGLLRSLGTPEEIAAGYRLAMTEVIKPGAVQTEGEIQATALEREASLMALVAGDDAVDGEPAFGNELTGGVPAVFTESEAASAAPEEEVDESIDPDLLREIAEGGYFKEFSNYRFTDEGGEASFTPPTAPMTKKTSRSFTVADPFESEEHYACFRAALKSQAPAWFEDALSYQAYLSSFERVETVLSALSEVGALRLYQDAAKKVKVYRLNKKERDIAQILTDFGIRLDADGKIDVKSGYGMSIKTSTTGLSLKFLTAGLRKANPGNAYYMLKNLKSMSTDDGAIPGGRAYSAVGFIESAAIVDSKNGSEPRVTIISEGTTLNAKFALSRFHQKAVLSAIQAAKKASKDGEGALVAEARRLMSPDGGSLTAFQARDALIAREISDTFDMLKASKKAVPFEFLIFVDSFKEGGSGKSVKYFKLEAAAKIAV